MAMIRTWAPHGPKGKEYQHKILNMKKTEVSTADQVANFRNSPLALEFLLKKKGKRILDMKTARGMQSKISLKFPLAALEKEKLKLKPSIKQSIIDDFEKAYLENCN